MRLPISKNGGVSAGRQSCWIGTREGGQLKNRAAAAAEKALRSQRRLSVAGTLVVEPGAMQNWVVSQGWNASGIAGQNREL